MTGYSGWENSRNNCGCAAQAVLAESGMCPFTKTAMRWEACTVLTHSNIERYKDRIKSN